MNKSNQNFLKPTEQQLNSLLKYYQTGQYVDAEKLSLSITKEFPEHQFAWNVLGAVLKQMGKINESLVAFKKSVKLNLHDAGAHFNLGQVLKQLGKLEEAETCFRKVVKLQPESPDAHNNLGGVLQNLDKLKEAELCYRKAIELKPDYFDGYNNLGTVLQNNSNFEEAELAYKKAIDLKPDSTAFHENLLTMLRFKELSLKINEAKKKNKDNKSKLNIDVGLTSNLFISNREVETELINSLYEINNKGLDETKGVFFGNGKHSINFQLFEQLFKNNYPIIKKVEEDLTVIMKRAVKSDIYIIDSFFNILNNGGGSVYHTHLNKFDRINNLVNQKYSLTYYLTVGDQKCSEPGILKLKNPDKEILPSKGAIMIFPANQKHSAFYNGKTDRVMIGVNFYSLI